MIKINNWNNIYRDSQVSDFESEYFKEGEILVGEILELGEKEAIIYLKNFGKIKAFVQVDLEPLKGKEINFLVKSSIANEIQLKPLLEPLEVDEIIENTNKEEMYLIKILNEYGIEEEPMAIEYVDNLIKYNVQINEKNVLFGIKVLDKLEQLMEIDKDSNILITLKGNSELEKEDIRNILIESKGIVEEKKINNTEINYLLDRENVKVGQNLLSENINKNTSKIELKNNQSNMKSYSILKDLKAYVNQQDTFKSDLVQTIAIFTRYKIKPSLNNIKYFLELNENPHGFLEDFKLLDEIEYNKFTNINKKAIINSGSLKNIIEESYIEYKNTIIEIEKNLKGKTLFDKTIKEKFQELENRLEFLEEINQELNYIFIPLNFNKDIYKDSIVFLKNRKKKKSPKDNINIFINLNTENLGNIKINCQVIGDTINVKFYGLNKEDVDLFKSKESELKNLIVYTGYNIGKIKYEYKYKDNILDFLIINKGPIYHLNIEV